MCFMYNLPFKVQDVLQKGSVLIDKCGEKQNPSFSAIGFHFAFSLSDTDLSWFHLVSTTSSCAALPHSPLPQWDWGKNLEKKRENVQVEIKMVYCDRKKREITVMILYMLQFQKDSRIIAKIPRYILHYLWSCVQQLRVNVKHI